MLHFALNPTQWSSMSMRKLICNLHLETVLDEFSNSGAVLFSEPTTL